LRPARNGGDERRAGAAHRVEDGLSLFGEELDELLRQRLREFGGVDEHSLFARRRVVDEPRFLEFQPSLRVEVVEFVGGHGGIITGGEKR